MRRLSNSATRWQLLRLMSVWGATILCVYCISVGTNFRESVVENRLATQIYKRNLTSSTDGDSPTPPTGPVLFKSELTPTAAQDSDPFDPPIAALTTGGGGRPQHSGGEDISAENKNSPGIEQGLHSKDEEKDIDIESDDSEGNNEEKEDIRDKSGDDADDVVDDKELENDKKKELTTTEASSLTSSSQNDAVVKRWLADHLRINGTLDWWEHRFPVWKLDLNPEVMGPYKTPNWPWVTLEVGRYDPSLFTHPPGELPRQRLPGVIIFGAGKCGTRALIEFLKMHPNLATARAEVHYFDENLDKGVEWYRTRMPLSYGNQITLEKSPSYLWEPRAPEELYKINRGVKLILLVKDPVVRIMSQAARMEDAEHRHELLFLAERDGQKTVKNDSNTVAAGLYVEHLKNWLKVFPLEQMHVMEGMELIRNPYKEIKKVEEFLELPRVLTEANFFLNESRGFYCPYPFYSRVPECLSSAKGVPHPKLSPEAEKLIYDFYRPYNEKLFQIIGKRFDWEPQHDTT